MYCGVSIQGYCGINIVINGARVPLVVILMGIVSKAGAMMSVLAVCLKERMSAICLWVDENGVRMSVSVVCLKEKMSAICLWVDETGVMMSV